MPNRLILASESPRRLSLLAQIGIEPAEVAPARINETPAQGERPRDLAARLAEAKARDVVAQFDGDFVLAADTVVACGRRVLGKMEEETIAPRCLELLSGRRHRVLGAVALITPDGTFHSRLVTTMVRFKRLESSEITDYLATGEWQGKAGAYAIQGHAAAFVAHINGSYSNVVGLPLYETAMMLRGLGLGAVEP